MDRNELSAVFPLFPLPDVVFFPDIQLPLSIFEPRYRAMVQHALDGNRLIGMVLLARGEKALEKRPLVYPLGCLGRIVACEEISNARCNIVLHGICRFRIESEVLTEAGYRLATTHLLDDPELAELPTPARAELTRLRKQLEETVLMLAQRSGSDHVARLRERMHLLDTVALVHALCFGLDCSLVEKQSLLEAPDPLERGSRLCGLFAFREAERKLPDVSRTLN